MKKKKNPSDGRVYARRLLTFFFGSLLCFPLMVVVLAAALIIENTLNPFRYKEADVLETCALLNLPTNSRFCSEPANQTPDLLREVIKEVEPSLPTTITELKALIKKETRCSTYNTEQMCWLYLPLERTSLRVFYTSPSDDTIELYIVSYSDS